MFDAAAQMPDGGGEQPARPRRIVPACPRGADWLFTNPSHLWPLTHHAAAAALPDADRYSFLDNCTTPKLSTRAARAEVNRRKNAM